MSVDLYVRDGSRFVRFEDAPHPAAFDVPPIPVPRPLDGPDALPAGWSVDPVNPRRITITAARCRHGSFARYAARHCCKGTRRDR